ncbi:MAG: GntR family transcriptional regulator [Gemmatimonadota bacterium]
MDTALRSGVPLHEQISGWIRSRIEDGEYTAHLQLPSENDLCRRFSVSRVTVRRALQTLEADGLIYRRQGLGSFVYDRRMAQGLVRLTDFAQDLARAGMEATSRVLHNAMEAASPAEAERLGLDAGTSILRLDRLRLGDGEPIALDSTWIPPYYAQLLEGHDLARETLYSLLERKYGIPATSGRYRITARTADPESAHHLQVKPGSALLVIERTTRTLGHRVVYFQRRFYRSDRMAYELELAREEGDAGGGGMGGGGPTDGGLPLREFEAVVQSASPTAPAASN